MKYLKYIFENEEVNSLVESQQELIDEAVNACTLNSLLIDDYVQENLEEFISFDDNLSNIYETIKVYSVQESLDMIDVTNEIIADSELTLEEKHYLLTEAVEEYLEEVSNGRFYTGKAKAYVGRKINAAKSNISRAAGNVSYAANKAAEALGGTKLGLAIANTKVVIDKLKLPNYLRSRVHALKNKLQVPYRTMLKDVKKSITRPALQNIRRNYKFEKNRIETNQDNRNQELNDNLYNLGTNAMAYRKNQYEHPSKTNAAIIANDKYQKEYEIKDAEFRRQYKENAKLDEIVKNSLQKAYQDQKSAANQR